MSILVVVVIFAVLFLAYTNGANDNFKGVATLYGSGIGNYRIVLLWTSAFTLAGSIVSLFIAKQLLSNFSGKGLVPDSLVNAPEFIISVALAAGLTVFIATKVGMPISTTHGLTGALIGAGLVAVGTQVHFEKLGKAFVLPLLLSPILAALLSYLAYSAFTYFRKKVLPETNHNFYAGSIVGLPANASINTLHYLSAAGVCFARGLNDTPKIAGLLLLCGLLSVELSILAIGLLMLIGGIVNSRKIAETMGKKITTLNSGQGFSASLVTAFLVTSASVFQLPVSTTHVSVGAVYGIGIRNKNHNNKVIKDIALSWLLTLPISAGISALCYWGISLTK